MSDQQQQQQDDEKQPRKPQQGLVPVAEQDFLEQDPPLRGQNYVCMSFLSPEKILRNKDVYYVSKFLGGLSADVQALFEGLTARFEGEPAALDMLKSIRGIHDYLFDAKALEDHYSQFVAGKQDELDREFYENNNFQTCVRGIKVRGTYDTLHDAQMRAGAIKKFDDKFDVFVAQVGCWCPWSPDPSLVADQEYSETQMNTLAKAYVESQENNRAIFNERLATSAPAAPGGN